MDIIGWAESATGAFIIGVALLLVAFRYIPNKMTVKTLGLFKLGGIVAIAFSLLSVAGIQLFATTSAPAASVGAFTVTVTDAQAWISEDNNAHTITWAVTHNYSDPTYAQASNSGVMYFNIQRGLGSVGLVQTYGELTTVPSVTNGTTGVVYPLLTQTGGQYNAVWNRSDGSSAYKMITVTIAETADGAVVALTMTLSTSALQAMPLYGSQHIALAVGGQTWDVTVMVAAEI